MDAVQDPQKSTKNSAAQLGSIREMIKEELAAGMRDLRVENERLQGRALRAEDRVKAVEKEGAALKESMRKLSSGQAKGVRAFVKEEVARGTREMLEQTKLKDRMAKAENEIAHAAIKTQNDLQTMESTLINRIASAVLGIKHDLKKEISRVETTVRSELERLSRDSDLPSSAEDDSEGEREAGSESSIGDDGKPADFDDVWPVKVGQTPMDGSRADEDEPVPQATPEKLKNTVVTLEGLDIDAVNNLLQRVTDTLCTTVGGNHYIKGSGFGSGSQHVALREVCELRDALLEIIAFAQRKTGTSTASSMKEGKTVGKAKASHLEAINKAITNSIDGPIRDLQIKADGTERRLQETEARESRLAAENLELKAKIESMHINSKTANAINTEVQGLGQRVATVEKHAADQHADLPLQLSREVQSQLEGRDWRLNRRLNENRDEAERQAREIRGEARDQVAKLTCAVEYLKTRLDDEQSQSRKLELVKRVDEVKQSILEIEERLEYHSSDIAGLEDDVHDVEARAISYINREVGKVMDELCGIERSLEETGRTINAIGDRLFPWSHELSRWRRETLVPGLWNISQRVGLKSWDWEAIEE